MTTCRSLPFVVRLTTVLILVPAAWSIWVLTGAGFRMLCGICCLVFTGLAVAFAAGKAGRAFTAAGVAVALLAISPVEVPFALRHGAPRIVPLTFGLPGPAVRERADQDEALHGGCMHTGLEPSWSLLL
jgi:hypothetical protein